MKKSLFFVFTIFSLIIFSKITFAAGIRIDKLSDNKYSIITEDAKATTSLPVSFDSINNNIVIATKNGFRDIKATPKKAIEVAYITGMLNEFQMDGKYKLVKFILSNKGYVYEVHGKKTGKIFGIWPVSYDVKAVIDDQGKLSSFEKPFILKFLKYVMK